MPSAVTVLTAKWGVIRLPPFTMDAAVEGHRVGGKTATSQTLPRGSGKYIASFLGFAPADEPQVLALAIIHNPQGTYYGGQIAAPVVKQLFENILPYLEEKRYN